MGNENSMRISELERNKLWKVSLRDSMIEVLDTEGEIYQLDDYEKERFHHGDVIEIDDSERIIKLHDASDPSALVFITNQCNSNCIMCPDSEYRRMKESTITTDFLLEYISLLPSDLLHIDVTGGEPTLLKYDLVRVLRAILDQTENADIQMLTNGRSFADNTYTELFRSVADRRLYVEVPVHASTEQLHDLIAGIPGAFEQTIRGIKNLLSLPIKVNIRIVVSKLNYHDLNSIIELIMGRFPQINRVNFLGLEIMGSAYHNREEVWIEYTDIKNSLESCIEYCVSQGLEPRLFNYPLCMFEKKYWYCYKKSITDYKIRYQPECVNCNEKNDCGGFFASTLHNTQFKVRPV